MPDTGEPRIGDQTVRRRTGRGWEEWFRLLDRWGAVERDHAAIARYMEEAHGVSGWWAQTVAVEYERERGLRERGQASSGDYQVSVQRTLPIGSRELWAWMTEAQAMESWLGGAIELAEGSAFELPGGGAGEVRVVRAGERLRLFLRLPELQSRSTLEVTLMPSGEARTALRFQHRQLATAAERDRMRERWRAAVGRIADGMPGSSA